MNTSSRSRRQIHDRTLVLQEFVANDAHELLNLLFCQRFRHKVGKVHIRANFLRGKSIRLGCLLHPQALHVSQRASLWARLNVVEASRCRFSRHVVSRSFATLLIRKPSDSILTAPHNSLSAEDSASTSCFCEGDGDVAGVVTPLRGVAQVGLHGIQVVEVGVQLRLHQEGGVEEDGEGQVEVEREEGEVKERRSCMKMGWNEDSRTS